MRVAGDVLWEKFNELGPTYRPNVLWEFGVLTCDPAIIKVSPVSGASNASLNASVMLDCTGYRISKL